MFIRKGGPTWLTKFLATKLKIFRREHSITVTRMKRFCVFLIKEDNDYILLLLDLSWPLWSCTSRDTRVSTNNVQQLQKSDINFRRCYVRSLNFKPNWSHIEQFHPGYQVEILQVAKFNCLANRKCQTGYLRLNHVKTLSPSKREITNANSFTYYNLKIINNL